MHIYNLMFGAMSARPTGLAMSVLRRSQALAKAGHTLEILTHAYSADFEDQMNTLRAEGSLNGGAVAVRNMYRDLSGDPALEFPFSYAPPFGWAQDGWEYARDPKNPDILRGTQSGEYKHFVWMRGDKVNGIDTLLQGKRVHRTWYDEVGRPCKIERMDSENRPHLVEYVNRAGNIYLQESKNPKGVTTNFALHTKSGILNFPSHSALVHHWLHEVVFNGVSGPFVISEYGFHRTSLQELERLNGAKVIFTIHNNHHAAPFGLGAPIRGEQRDFFEHLQEYRGVVLLTDEQRDDILAEFDEPGNLHVIPHHMPETGVTGKRDRDPNRVIMVGRFHEIKGHADVVRAFAKVAANNPNASLHLYGRGPEEGALKDLTRSLGLEEVVHFPGFTPNAFEEFALSAVSVVASSYEGFCLSLAESMAVGCVPVAYNFKYGPRDLVTDGVDGLIVEQGNIEALADALSALLADPIRRERMAESAQAISNRLSEQKTVSAWERIFSAQ